MSKMAELDMLSNDILELSDAGFSVLVKCLIVKAPIRAQVLAALLEKELNPIDDWTQVTV
jgi:hypothetical protein